MARCWSSKFPQFFNQVQPFLLLYFYLWVAFSLVEREVYRDREGGIVVLKENKCLILTLMFFCLYILFYFLSELTTISIVLYGSKCWTTSLQMKWKLEATKVWFYRRTLRIPWTKLLNISG